MAGIMTHEQLSAVLKTQDQDILNQIYNISLNLNIDLLTLSDCVQAFMLNKNYYSINRSNLALLTLDLKKAGNSLRQHAPQVQLQPTVKIQVSQTMSLFEEFNNSLPATNCLQAQKPTVQNIISRLSYPMFYTNDQNEVKQKIQRKIDQMKHRYSLQYPDIEESLSDHSANETLVIGQIFCEDKPGMEDTYLRNSTESIGLDISNVQDYNLYSGQVVLAQGTFTNEIFYANMIVPGILPGTRTRTEQEIATWTSFGAPNVHIAAVCGPYSSDNDLEYIPLFSLFYNLDRNPVNVLIMQGPLIDVGNKKVADSDIRCSFINGNSPIDIAELQNQLVQLIKQKCAERKIQLVLIPSVKDALHPYPLPQPKFSGISADIILGTNPAQITVNDLLIGVTPFNTIMEMIKYTGFKSPIQINKIQLSLAQLLEQGSLFPLYPSNLPVDCTKMDYFDTKALPDIVITPTNLKFTALFIGNTLFVNPQTLMFRGGVGAYAHIQVSSFNRNAGIERRARVSFFKGVNNQYNIK